MERDTSFPNGVLIRNFEVSEVGDGLYRLEDHPWMVEGFVYKDTVRAESDSDGGLHIKEVVTPGQWTAHHYTLTRSAVDSDWLNAALKAVVDSGGAWERVFGGLLVLLLPPQCELDPAVLMSAESNNPTS